MAEKMQIIIDVDSGKATTKIKRVNDDLGKTEKAAKQGSSAVSGLGTALGGLAIGTAFIASISKLTSVARGFDVINASLITVTGSEKEATKAFSNIQSFAASTPFALEQVANAFIKMKALGLDPSNAALTSYGNTASAMGKDLNQMIEAVADAATGEFERLKEFGIKARQQGDDVALTFRGVTTTVAKNSADIESYLMNIGQTDFAGAMETRAATLDGALSNLGDSWDNLFLTMSNSGIGGILHGVAIEAGRALEGLTLFIDKTYGNNKELNLTLEIGKLSEQMGVLRAATEKAKSEGDGFFNRLTGGSSLSRTGDAAIATLKAQIDDLVKRRAALITEKAAPTNEGKGSGSSSSRDAELSALKDLKENRAIFFGQMHADEIEKAEEYLAKIAASRDLSAKTDIERENIKYASLLENIQRRQDTLIDAGITEDEAKLMTYEARETAELNHLDKMAALNLANSEKIAKNKAAADKIISDADDKRRKQAKAGETQFWADSISLMNSGSRKAFEFGKQSKTANALISGYDAATSAWSAGMSTGGPWAPLVAASYTAASLAKTGFLVQSIQGTSFGSKSAGVASGGSVPNIGGGGASTTPLPPTPQQSNGQQGGAFSVHVTVDGATRLDSDFAQKITDLIVPRVNQAQDRGAGLELSI